MGWTGEIGLGELPFVVSDLADARYLRTMDASDFAFPSGWRNTVLARMEPSHSGRAQGALKSYGYYGMSPCSEWRCVRVPSGPGGLYDTYSRGLSKVCRHVPTLSTAAQSRPTQPSPTMFELSTSIQWDYVDAVLLLTDVAGRRYPLVGKLEVSRKSGHEPHSVPLPSSMPVRGPGKPAAWLALGQVAVGRSIKSCGCKDLTCVADAPN